MEARSFNRLFDDTGEGFITVTRFRVILKEIDEDFTEDELDEIISEVVDNKIGHSFQNHHFRSIQTSLTQ